MVQVSRRALLAGGGIALGAAAAGSPFVPAPGANAVSYDPSFRTARIDRFPDPAPFATFAPLPNKAVMQDVVLVDGTFFVTQGVAGANGDEDTVINRISAATGQTVDRMTLIGGGHGYGFEVEAASRGFVVWTTWEGSAGDAGRRGNDFVRFTYTAGAFERDDVEDRLQGSLVPFQNRASQYHFDRAKGWAVERHFNYPQGSEALSETFTRRRLRDLVTGGNAPDHGVITVPATPPTSQGFATLNDTLFRWLGTAVVGNVIDPDDPVKMEQYDWNTGRLVAVKEFPSISQQSAGRWAGGFFEPQGMSVYREADGTASLIVGDCTGPQDARQYHVSRFLRIGDD